MIDRNLFRESLVYILGIVAIGLTVIGQVLVKIGMDKVGIFTFSIQMFIRAFTEWHVFIGFVLAFLGSIFWLGVVSRIPFSVAYPLLSISYILSVFAARFVFNENISPIRYVGVFLICVGIVLAARR